MTYHLPFSKEEIYNNYWGCVDATFNQYSSKNFVITKKGSVTFGEVDALSNSIVSAVCNKTGLFSSGIGIFLKDPRLVIPCMIGIMKSGNYIVVMDVAAPEQIQRTMIQDAGIKLILTNSEYVATVQLLVGNDTPVINIENLDIATEKPIGKFKYSFEDTAQILFTSGSSGKPKGAIKDYRFHVHAVYIHSKSFDYQPEDRLLQLSSFTFSGMLNAVFAALLIGFSIYYYDVPEEGLSGLPEWISESKITLYHSTPTMFRSLSGAIKPGTTFPSVRIFSLGGEKRLKSDIIAAKKFFPRISSVRLGYTGTEMHSVTVGMFPVDELLKMDILPSGTPYEGVQVQIWDEESRPVPQGKEGEIVVYSQSLARGYINNPELTKQKFIPDNENPGWQYFKTGDLGKILTDGQLIHLGRIDKMTKIRGIRIELDNLENILSSYPGIIQAVSRVFEDDQGTKKLVCYFVPEKGIQIPNADLRRYLAERLPRQQLPNLLFSLDSLPLTSSGKLSIEQLPVPSFSRPQLPVPYQAPESDLERKLIKIWEDNLGLDGIGVLDDFFDLGGDSLVGVLMFSAIEEILGKSLPVSTLIRAPNVQTLASFMNNQSNLEINPVIIPINTKGNRDPWLFIPGKGGYPTRIRHLSQKIDQEIPIYAFQFHYPKKNNDPKFSLGIIANEFLMEIKKISPVDTFVLLGESMGGLVAYEMAQQMVAAGSKPPLVIMLDTYNNQSAAPDYYHSRKLLPYYAMLIRKHSSIWLNSDWQGKKEYLKFYRETIYQKAVHHIRGHFFKPRKRKNAVLPESVTRREEQNLILSKLYTVKPYPGKVLLIKASRGSENQEVSHGWDEVGIKELVIQNLDCYHGSILFEPAVTELAKIIQSHIK